MLFPDRSAVTLAQFLRDRGDTSAGDSAERGEGATAASAVCHDTSAVTSDKSTASDTTSAVGKSSVSAKTRPLQVIVLDGAGHSYA